MPGQKTDAELKAEFLARKGVTVCPPDAKTIDEKDMFLALRGRLPASHRPKFRLVHNTAYGDVWVNDDGEPI